MQPGFPCGNATAQEGNFKSCYLGRGAIQVRINLLTKAKTVLDFIQLQLHIISKLVSHSKYSRGFG